MTNMSTTCHCRLPIGSWGIIESQKLDDQNRTRVNLVYQTAFSRPANENELELGDMTLSKLERDWHGDRTQALATYCHTIFQYSRFPLCGLINFGTASLNFSTGLLRTNQRWSVGCCADAPDD